MYFVVTWGKQLLFVKVFVLGAISNQFKLTYRYSIHNSQSEINESLSRGISSFVTLSKVCPASSVMFSTKASLRKQTFMFRLYPQETEKTENSIRLKVTRGSSGQYKCEVSTEAPNFATTYRKANLTVIGKLKSQYYCLKMNTYCEIYNDFNFSGIFHGLSGTLLTFIGYSRMFWTFVNYSHKL